VKTGINHPGFCPGWFSCAIKTRLEPFAARHRQFVPPSLVDAFKKTFAYLARSNEWSESDTRPRLRSRPIRDASGSPVCGSCTVDCAYWLNGSDSISACRYGVDVVEASLI